MDNWIPTTEKLPEGGTDVIVHKHNGVVAAMRYFDYKFQYRQGIGKWLDQTSQILHWQKLPDPPPPKQVVHTPEETNAWDNEMDN